MTSREKGISRLFIEELEGIGFEISGHIMDNDNTAQGRIALNERLRAFLDMADIRAPDDVISFLFYKHAGGQPIINEFVTFCVNSRRQDPSTPLIVDNHLNLQPLN